MEAVSFTQSQRLGINMNRFMGWRIDSALPGVPLQPYVRYETIDVDDKDSTDFLSAGLNYYLKDYK